MAASQTTAAAKARETVDATQFFQLADAVLAGVGRPGFGAVQRRIVEVRDDDRVLQILAGPGSGKTEVLVWRVLFELFVNGAEPARLLITTFTRKAAQELSLRMVERSDGMLAAARERGVALSDPGVHDLRIGTVHSLCDQLLCEFDEEHLEAGTRMIDETEARIRFSRVRNWLFRDPDTRRRVLNDVLNVDELAALFRPPWFDNRMTTMQSVDLARRLIDQHVETWIPRCQVSGMPNGVESVHGPSGLTDDLIWLQQRWEEYLDDNNVLDFATLQKRFLARQAGLLEHIDHVFVDELQDTNPIQYAIHLGWLANPAIKLTAVGDDDQALYRWRGSDIDCFANLEGDAAAAGVAYRREVLEENFRSTANIVAFAQGFRESTVLASESLPKTVRAPVRARKGKPVRLVEGEWTDLCDSVAAEADRLGVGRPPKRGEDPAPTLAILMASTSERESRNGTSPALDLRRALEAKGLRVYNPRNKAAARPESPVQDLFGLISYLIDPVSKAPAGEGGRTVEVFASCGEEDKAAFATTAAPEFFISTAHASTQKRLIKRAGAIGAPGPELAPLLSYLDEVRERLLRAEANGEDVRLTLGGLVARLLRMEPFRSCGYTMNLFRQALFTQLLEANVAATRLTRDSLERPLNPRREKGKVVWERGYWAMLNVFGQLIEAGGQDDLEVEAFAEDAVSLLTFHQAKGLEFDHVYVAMTGKEVEPSSVLATELFSGNTPSYKLTDGLPTTKKKALLRRAEADRERELYVAATRAKQRLSILHDPNDERWATALNHGFTSLFAAAPTNHRGSLSITEWRA